MKSGSVGIILKLDVEGHASVLILMENISFFLSTVGMIAAQAKLCLHAQEKYTPE